LQFGFPRGTLCTAALQYHRYQSTWTARAAPVKPSPAGCGLLLLRPRASPLSCAPGGLTPYKSAELLQRPASKVVAQHTAALPTCVLHWRCLRHIDSQGWAPGSVPCRHCQTAAGAAPCCAGPAARGCAPRPRPTALSARGVAAAQRARPRPQALPVSRGPCPKGRRCGGFLLFLWSFAGPLQLLLVTARAQACTRSEPLARASVLLLLSVLTARRRRLSSRRTAPALVRCSARCALAYSAPAAAHQARRASSLDYHGHARSLGSLLLQASPGGCANTQGEGAEGATHATLYGSESAGTRHNLSRSASCSLYISALATACDVVERRGSRLTYP